MKSVAMAFYNGAKYIDEQIRSILDNMEETDELIISVDDASDGSEAILRNWVENDQRIRMIKGPGKGAYDVRKACKKGAPICLFIDWRQYPSITDALQWAG